MLRKVSEAKGFAGVKAGKVTVHVHTAAPLFTALWRLPRGSSTLLYHSHVGQSGGGAGFPQEDLLNSLCKESIY